MSLLRALDKRFADFMTRHRVGVIVGFCLPASAVFGVGYRARQWVQRRRSSPADHHKRVEAIQQQVQRWNEQPESERLPMCTDRAPWVGLSTRFVDKNVLHRIQLGNLRSILKIDTERQTVTCEPLVTVGEITRELQKHGYMLAVTLEVEDATVGGLAMAVGMTTHSHKVGLYQETVVAYEMVTGDGRVVRATAEENTDLFRALPWSHGTLGFLVGVELKIIPTQSHVRLRYEPLRSQEEYAARIRELSMGPDRPDFVEATIFSKEEAVVMSGEFATPQTPAERAKINPVNRWHKPWFFEHVRQKLQGNGDEEYIPLRDYLHRHDRAIFWTLRDMIPFGNHPAFRWTLGWMCPPRIQFLKLTTTPGIRELTFTKQVFQDIVLPLTALERAVELSEHLFDIYPVLVYPCAIFDHGEHSGQLRPPRPDARVPGTDFGMYMDLGVYGVPAAVRRGEPYNATLAMRAMEHFTREVGGYPFLYADTFMTEDEFREMFDHTLYEQVRHAYGAEGAFPSLFGKTKPEVDVIAIGNTTHAELRTATSGRALRSRNERLH
ncbi:FAD-binding oxidoreductase [Paraliomyxa miuraensis]|uniref:FAD-binding oxidoreductase n=1 Tax=Paraliomyxa miuraensis TaxID=376150 RepID=UPI00224D9932|nr:FAD-binding protein [Paraliomyxa miuraensis]MCX4248011.1 FAD-binding protein [Paraliomyxa miuraensis]